MRALFLGTALISLVSGFAMPAGAQTLPYRGNPRAGAELALRVCDACHVVARTQEYPPIMKGYAPGFYEIANEPGLSAAGLEEFLAHPHAFVRMPYPELTTYQIADVTAYILALRGRH